MKKCEHEVDRMPNEPPYCEEFMNELESKAAKWDMIQWAIDTSEDFISQDHSGLICLSESDLKRLEQLYEECCVW